MQKITVKLRILFFSAILSSICFVAGIPMIILGASNGITPLTVTGIVLTAVDFYAMPILWVNYGGKRVWRRVLIAVLSENILTVSGLSAQLALPEEEVRKILQGCVQQCYLTGYLFDGELLTLNTNKNPQDRILVAECESCGAQITYRPGETPVCPYCGSTIRVASGH